MANVTDSSNFHVSRSVNVSDMIVQRQIARKFNTKTFLPERKRESQYFQCNWKLEVDLQSMFYFMQ